MAPLVALVLLLWAPTALGAEGSFNYSLAGSDWPGLCQSGEFQSPINIVTRNAALKPQSLTLLSRVGQSFKLVNTGSNVNIVPTNVSSLWFNGVKYNLLQVHGHAYSEHSFDGYFTAIELHLVHTKASNSSELLVLGVPMRLDDNNQDNAFLESWLDLAPTHAGKTVRVNKVLDFYSLVQNPANRTSKTIYTYPGSLTTPKCSQGVTWLSLDPKFCPTVSVPQVIKFETLISETAHGVPVSMRPPQPLKGRNVTKFVVAL